MNDDFKDDLDALTPDSWKKKPEKRKPPLITGDAPAQSSMDEYLSMPAFSCSLLSALLDECPYSAWYQSWLNPNPPPRKDTDQTDLGTIAHALLLEGGTAKIAVIDPFDYPAKTTGAVPTGWTNNAIRAARDEARAAGLIPLLPGDVGQVNAMVDAAHEYIESLRNTEPAIWRAFQPDGGASEQTFTWEDGGTLCRIRADRISNDHAVIINPKTTARSVEPDAWGRSQLAGMGYYRTDAFYRRGIRELFGIEPTHVFLVISCEPPHLCSLVGCDPAWQAAGDAEVTLGLHLWRKCVAANRWPKHPNRVAYPQPPAYLVARQQEIDAVQQYGNPYDPEQLFERSAA